MSDIENAVRAWAKGMYPLEAGAELLIRAGRVYEGAPWVKAGYEDRVWIDVETLVYESGVLSGGERRVVDVAASLLSPDHPVDLHDAVTGIDRKGVDLVLAAIAHASGSHEHSTFAMEGVVQSSPIRRDRAGSLYPWPESRAGETS